MEINECRNFIKTEIKKMKSYIPQSIKCRTENDEEYERVIVECKLENWAYITPKEFDEIAHVTGMHLNYYAHFATSVEIMFVRERKTEGKN
jgi:hypothetical protein